MVKGFSDDKSTLLEVMAWCQKAIILSKYQPGID